MYRRFGKRLFDIAGGALLLVLLSPVLLLAALAVRVKLGRPVLFRHARPGLHGKPFTLVKFRTMSDAKTADGQWLPDEARLGRFGQWFRSTSLDELPEIWNVVRGDMSLVGPRPLLMQYLPRYSARQAKRHLVRPGITGLAQVRGRNALQWDIRLELDVRYVEDLSLRLDLMILLRTLEAVIRRRGIRQADRATVDEFRGS